MQLKETILLRLYTFFKIPLISYCKPVVISFDDTHLKIRIPLNRRTKNHINSMYFGALSVGADLAGGFLALLLINKKKTKQNIVFKSASSTFLKRAEGDVYFTCNNGKEILETMEKSKETKERQNIFVDVEAHCYEYSTIEPIATFKMELSVK